MRPIQPEHVEDIIALSPLQEGLFIYYENFPESQLYHEQLLFQINGAMERELFEKSWQAVMLRNEMLRTVFRWKGLQKPVQMVLKEMKPPIHWYDYSQEADPPNRLAQLIRDDYQTRIDLESAPLRIIVCKSTAGKSTLILSFHHLLFDGWSLGVLLKEFLSAYEQLDKHQEPELKKKSPYKEYVKYCKKQTPETHRQYWQEYLRGFTLPTGLPYDGQGVDDWFETALVQQFLPDDLLKQLDSFVKEHQMALSIILYAGWGILLQKYNNSSDAIFGTTVAGRSIGIKDIDNMVGLFINTLPLRVKAQAGKSVMDLLHSIQQELKQRTEYEGVPLSQIKAGAEIQGSKPLFHSIVIIENYPVWDLLTACSARKFQLQLEAVNENPNYHLTLMMMAFDKLELRILYQKHLFLATTIESLVRHYLQIIKNIITNPTADIATVDMLVAEEKNHLLAQWETGFHDGGYDFE